MKKRTLALLTTILLFTATFHPAAQAEDYDIALAAQQGFAIVADASGSMGVVNGKGELFIPASFKRIEHHICSRESGEVVFLYTEWEGVGEDGAAVRGRSGMMDSAGNRLTEAVYDSYELCLGTPFVNVERDGKWNTLNDRGELLYIVWMDDMVTIRDGDEDTPALVTALFGNVVYLFAYEDRKLLREEILLGEEGWATIAIYDEWGNRAVTEDGAVIENLH